MTDTPEDVRALANLPEDVRIADRYLSTVKRWTPAAPHSVREVFDGPYVTFRAYKDAVETLAPLADEMMRIAQMVGEGADPFAAWETVEALLATRSSPSASQGAEVERARGAQDWLDAMYQKALDRAVIGPGALSNRERVVAFLEAQGAMLPADRRAAREASKAEEGR